ncbi:hypothetical protein A0U92_16410 [Acetobacter aceti]|uniref:Thioredoxin domain-containing protein n=1 Tax=Acetobacter aceti TaxID=435 RepID=A0A1U9KK01_ACEAC|nr:hypothetical protein A0U92_16410 [Acetobacter aceti]
MSTSFLALAGLFLSLSASAAESQPVTSERDTASLVTDSDRIEAGHPFKAGLLLHLKPGWHTYWKNPGDAGEPVNLTVTLSGHLSGKADAIEWPAPERLPEGPLMSYGYTGDVLLPVTITPQAADAQTRDTSVSAHADWLVCAAVCVPEQADFHLDLPTGAVTSSPQSPLFTQSAERQPRPSPFQITITPNGLLTVQGEGLSSQAVRQAWVIPDVAGRIDQVAPQSLTVGQNQMTLRLKPEEGFAEGKSFTGLLELRDAANEKSVLSFNATPVAAASPIPENGWLALVVFAFLGGLILNLMPCVFPVLAMKALAILRLHEDRKHFQSGLAYTAGVLAMFGFLGSLTLALRNTGLSAGWGFQFQSPLFVAGICWLLFAVGLGMLGIFELPVISTGQSVLSRYRGLSGDFLTGLLAVLVATPCTAPFMGAALAGALTAPPMTALGIFLAMGLGLACPYLAITLVPNAGRFLPRPGRWMDIVRQSLAFPMFATCIWLVWVLAQQGGGNLVAVGCAGLLALGFSGWLMNLSRAGGASGRSRPVTLAAVVIALSPVALLPLLSLSSEISTDSVNGAPDGETAFSPERLAALRKDGKPVFVDMTAAWCITCLVNEHVALESPFVQKSFSQHGVTFMKGDWTRKDANITAFLRDHGRDGVPLYVYYPSHAEGRVLPQILTPALIIRAIEEK